MLPESRAVNVAVTWEESCCAYPGRSCRREVGESESRSNNELQEVSRSHSTLKVFFSREGLNNRKSQVKTGRRSV